MNPSMGIIIGVLLFAFLFMGFFCIYVRRCAEEDESLETSRRGARGANAQARGVEEGTRGLERDVIESFPVFTYTAATRETLDCVVCLLEFEDNEQLRLLPNCNHAFHPECIDMWLLSHTTCPVCRKSLVPTEEANPTDTGDGIIEPPEFTPPEEVTIVVDGARSRSRNGSVRRDNVIEIPLAPESADSHKTARRDGINKFRRSHSTGHSLQLTSKRT